MNQTLPATRNAGRQGNRYATRMPMARWLFPVSLMLLFFVCCIHQSYGQTYLFQGFETEFVGGNGVGYAPPASTTDGSVPSNSAWTQQRLTTVNGIQTYSSSGSAVTPVTTEPSTGGSAKDWMRSVGTGTSTWTSYTGPYATAPTVPYNTSYVPNVASAGGITGSTTDATKSVAWFNDGNATPSGGLYRQLTSPSINTSVNPGGGSQLLLSFKYLYYYSGSATTTVVISTDGGTTWADLQVLAQVISTGPVDFPTLSIVIPSKYRSANMKIGFRVLNTYGSSDIFLDDVTVKEFTPPTVFTVAANAGGTSTSNGRWSSTCTWVGGVVPGPLDSVEVPAGANLVIDQNVYVKGISVSGSLLLNAGAIRVACVGNLTINNGGTVDLTPVALSAVGCATSATAGTSTPYINLFNVSVASGGTFKLSGSTITPTIGLLGQITNRGTITSGGSGTITVNLRGNLDNSGTGSFTISGTSPLNTSTSTTVRFIGYSPQTVSGNTITVFSSTMLNPTGVTSSAQITLGNGTTSGTPTFTRGVLTFTGSALLFVNNTSYANANTISSLSWVNGPVQYLAGTARTTATFPLGDATNSRPLIFGSSAFTGGISTSTIQASIDAITKSATTVNSPLTGGLGIRAYKVTTSSLNYSSTAAVTLQAGISDDIPAFQGLYTQVRIAQATAANTGPYTTRGNANTTVTALPTANSTVVSSPTLPTGGGSSAFDNSSATSWFTFATTAVPASITSTLADNPNTSDASQGALNVDILRATITTGTGNLGSYTLTGATVASNNANDADITNVKLWSSTSSTFTVGTATQISTGTVTFSGGVATFTGLNYTIPSAGTTSYLYVTYDISSSSTGASIGAQLNAGALSITAVNSASAPGTQPATTGTTPATRAVVLPAPFNSQTATRALTSTVSPGSTDNQIIGVTVNIGTGGSINLTALTFNTSAGFRASTSPTTDIATAKVYYTNTSNTFSNATLFGTVTAPNGQFTVNGTAALNGGSDNYFWLVYDINNSAANYDVVNATLVSSVVNGTTQTYSGTQPDGYRQVYAASANYTEPFEVAFTGTNPNALSANGFQSSSISSTSTNYGFQQATSASYTGSSGGAFPGARTGSGIGWIYNWLISSGNVSDFASPKLDFSSRNGSTANITFSMYRNATSSSALFVYVNTSNTIDANAKLLKIVYGQYNKDASSTAPTGTNWPASSSYYSGYTATSGLNATDIFAPQASAAGWQDYTVPVPAGYPASGNNLYVILRDYSDFTYNIFIDNLSVPNFPTPMAYTGATYTQQNPSSVVSPGIAGQQIVAAQLTTTGTAAPMTVTKLKFNTNGSTAPATDIANAKLYYTTTNTFSTANQFGSTVVSPSGSFSFTGSQVLPSGTLYFWLTYDIASGAPNGNKVTATLDSVQLNDQPYQARTATLSGTAGYVNITIPATYTSSTVSQVSSGTTVLPGTTNTAILSTAINMTTIGAPVKLTSVSFNTTGSTAPTTDITSVRLYWTSTNTFSTATPFGSAVTTGLGASSITVTSSLDIPAGTSYLWLAYNVSASAPNYDVLDGQITSLTIAGTAQTPTVTNPSGYLQVLQSLYLSSSFYENFENAATHGADGSTNGWTIVTGTYSWNYATTMTSSPSATAKTGTNQFGATITGTKFATMNTYNASNSSDLISPALNYNNRNGGTATIGFWVYRSTSGGVSSYTGEGIQVWVNTTNSVTGGTLLYAVPRTTSQSSLTGLPSTPVNGVAGAEAAVNGWYYYTTTVPASYASGNVYVIFRCQGNGGYDSGLDEVSIDYFPTAPTGFAAYSSSSATQITGNAVPGANNVQILKIPVTTTGNIAPLTAQSLYFTTGGSTRLPIGSAFDISKARVYYTGASATFATTTQFGTDVTSNNATTGAFTVSGSQVLPTGTSYFWLVYDIPSTANQTNTVVDATIDSILINDQPFSARVPSVTNPSGNRQVVAPMTITSINATQVASGTRVPQGTSNVSILQVNVKGSSTGSSIDLTQLSFGAATTTVAADIKKARVYFTGTSSTFATTTQFGSDLTAISLSSDFVFTGTQALANSDNYFWLVYDVNSVATSYDLLDAKLTAVTAGAASQTITAGDPVGYTQVYNTVVAVSENFDSPSTGTAPNKTTANGFTSVSTSTTYGWEQSSNYTSSNPSNPGARAGAGFGWVQDFSLVDNNVVDLISPVLDFSSRNGATANITYSVYRSTDATYNTYRDAALVYVNTSPTIDANAQLLQIVYRDKQYGPSATAPTGSYWPTGYSSSIIAPAQSVDGWYDYSASVPSSYTGNQVYVIIRNYSNFGINFLLDELNVPNFPTLMSYVSNTPTATNTAVPQGLVNAVFQQVKVTTNGNGNPISLTNFNLSAAGSTNAATDLSSAKIYYTGTSAAFTTTKLFGTGTPSGTFDIAGTQALANGDNYFWIVYDIKATATVNNVASLTVNSFTLNDQPLAPRSVGTTATRTITTPMTYVGASVTRLSSDPVFKGATNQQIVGYQVNMSATGASLNLTQVAFTFSGTVSTDISAARLYYSGNSSTAPSFVSANQFGSALTGSTQQFTGVQPLANGTNYFWLVYDVAAGATSQNVLNATAVNVIINGTTYAISSGTASGTGRTIVPAYCSTSLQTVEPSVSNNYIKNVTITAPANSPAIGSFGNTSTQSNTGYAYYATSVATATLTKGVSYTFTVKPSVSNQNIGVWIDYNLDGTFSASEYTQIAATTTAGTNVTATVAIPTSATSGLAALRIRQEPVLTSSDACTSFTEGNTQDYLVTLQAQPACTGTPVAGTISGTSNFCTGFSNTLTLGGSTVGYSGITYAWKSSTTSGGPYTAVTGGIGAATLSYTTPSNITANTYYVVDVTCGANTVTSPQFALVVNTPVYASFSATTGYATSFESAWTSQCAVSDVPSNSWRNNTAVSGDASWRSDNDATTANSASWTASTVYQGAYSPAASDGSRSARFHSTVTPATSNFDLYLNLSTVSGLKTLNFDYINTDGADNLAISVSTDGGSGFNQLIVLNNVSDWTTQAISLGAAYSNSATTVIRFAATGSPLTANSSDIGIDNISVVKAVGCNGTPTAGNVVTNTTSSCSVSSYTLSLVNYSTDLGVTLQWQKSTDNGVTFTSIAGETTPTYTATGITNNTKTIYQVLLKCTNTGDSSTSGQFDFTGFIPTPTAGTVSSAVVRYCSTGTGTVSVTGASTGVTYQWQQSATLTGTYTNVSGANATTYTGATAGYYRLKVTCGGGTPVYSSVITVFSNPTVASLPYTQNFESWQTLCSAGDVPDLSWNSGTSASNTSYPWRRSDGYSSSGSYGPANSDATATTGSYSARFHSYLVSAGQTSNLDLYVDFSSNSDKKLTFDYINVDQATTASVQDNMVIQYSTDGGATFNAMSPPVVAGVAANWTTYTVLFSGATFRQQSNFVIRFLATGDFGASDIGLDNVTITTLNACTAATSLTLPATTYYCSLSPVTLAPTTSPTVSGLTYQWKKSASANGTYTNISGATSSTYTFTPTSLTTTLYYQLVVSCGTNKATSTTAAVIGSPAIQYATLSPSTPYTQDFESWVTRCSNLEQPSINWLNTPNTGTNSWRRNDQGSTANWPTSIVTTNLGDYAPTSSTGNYSARYHQYATSTPGTLDLYIDFSSSNDKQLTFDYFNKNTSGSLTVFYSTDGGSTFTSTGYTVTTNTAWSPNTINFSGSAYYGKSNFVIRFQATGANNSGLDLAIDNVKVSEQTPCSAGTLTAGTLPAAYYYCSTSAVRLTATGYSTDAGVTYQWLQSSTGTAGSFVNVTGGSGATTASYTTPANLSGTIYYQFAVTCNLDPTNPKTVTTVVSAPATPSYAPISSTQSYTQSFESWGTRCALYDNPDSYSLVTPISGNNSWKRNNQGASNGWTSPTLGAYSPTSTAGSYSARFHSYSTTATGTYDVYLNFIGNKNRTLTFDYINPSTTSSLKVFYSTNGGTTFTSTSLVALANPATWTSVSVPLYGYGNTNFIIRFSASNTSTLTTDIGLDNISVTELPSCTGTPTAGTITASTAVCTGNTLQLTATGATSNTLSGISYQWQKSTSASGPFTNVTEGVDGTGSTTSTFTTAALSTASYYQFVVTCSGGASATSTVTAVTIKPFYQCYCGPDGSVVGALHSTACSSNDNISTVSIGNSTLNNSSACGSANGTAFTRYANTVVTQTGTLYTGIATTFNVTTARSGQYVGLWIDYNQNGTFESSEYASVSSGTTVAGTNNSAVVTIPVTATVGTTGIRFRSSNSPILASGACTSYSSGETEDYVVDIQTAPSCAAPANVTVSNITSTGATVSWLAALNETGGYYLRYRVVGATTWKTDSVATGVLTKDLANLTGGNNYEVQLNTKCVTGLGTVWSVSSTFTTIPAFDEPCGATPIAIVSGKGCNYVTYTNAQATSGTQGNISCLTTPSAWSKDVWFTATVPASGTIAIDLRSTSTFAVQLLTATSCSGTFTAVTTGTGSNCSNATVPYIYRSGLTAGTTVYIRVSRQGSNVAGASFNLCVTDGLYWVGITSSAWGTGSNWMGNAVPTASMNPIVPKGTPNAPVISGSSPANNLTIDSTTSVSINGTLTVSGNFVNRGTVSGTGTLTFNGTGSTQTLTTSGNKASTTVNNLTIAASSATTVKQSGKLSVTGSLTVTSGKYDANGQTLVLVSTATGTARIGTLATGTLLNATSVTQQRYVSPSTLGATGTYAFLGSPIVGTTLQTYKDGGVTLAGFNGANLTGTNIKPSAWFYDPTDVSNPAYQGWLGATDVTNSVSPGTGVRLFLSNALVNAGTPVSVTGTVQQGTLNVPLKFCASGCSYTSTNGGTTNGYNLVSNPYPSEIDWSLISSADRPNVDDAIFIYRHKQSGYATYVGGVAAGVAGASNVIASSQGFFVRATASGASITFRESHKVSTGPSFLRRPADAKLIRISMSADRNGNSYSDDAVVRFEDLATTNYDGKFDAGKMAGGVINLATRTNGQLYAINAQPTPATTDSISLVASSVNSTGACKFTFSEMESLPAGMTVYLKDNYLGTTTLVNNQDVYNYTVTADSLSNAATRFVLVFAPNAVTGISVRSADAQFRAYPNPNAGNTLQISFSGFDRDAVKLSIVDVLGKEVYSTTLQGSRTELTNKSLNLNLATGMYTVICKTDNTVLKQKLVVNK